MHKKRATHMEGVFIKINCLGPCRPIWQDTPYITIQYEGQGRDAFPITHLKDRGMRMLSHVAFINIGKIIHPICF